MRILVIEDQPDIRATLRDLLEINGHEVLEAEDGVQGVKLAAEKPGFIFCDVTMPNLDGHGVLAAIRQMPGVADIPFVFLTAKADHSDRRAGMTSGADDYITKPFTEADILGAIAARTGRQQALREKIATLGEQQRRAANAHWSHELLTPLNAVIGSLELLETMGESVDPAELKEMLALIRAGAERQERLARKLIRHFELERLLAAPPAAGSFRCDAAVALAAGAARAAQAAQRTGDLRLRHEPGMVALSAMLLADAVAELVENACRFSKPGQSITVSGRRMGPSYRIEVDDEGPGLPADQQKSVGAFAQFNRQQHEQQGLGLGLAIARATASVAGGGLTIQGGPNGRGLRVILELP